MKPVIFGPDVTSSYASLARRPGEWASVRGSVEAIRIYFQCVTQDQSANGAGGVGDNYFPQLQADGFWAWLAAQIAAGTLAVDVEGPASKFWDGHGCDGTEPIQALIQTIDRLRSVGCAPRNISLDEPLQSSQQCGYSFEQTADVVARVIKEVRNHGQNNIDLTFAYRANTGPDIVRFAELLQARDAAFTGVDIDFDPFSLHDQLPDTFFHHHVADDVGGQELRELRWYCQQWQVPLRFIIMGNRGTTPATYQAGCADAFQYVQRLLQGEPDAWIFESWKGVPGGLPINLPESDPYSHTGIIGDAVAGRLHP